MLTKEQNKQLSDLITEAGVNQSRSRVWDKAKTVGFDAAVSEIEIIKQEIVEAEARITTIEYLPEAAPLYTFGRSLIAQNAIDDITSILRLPYVLGGAIMADGHRTAENDVPVGGVIVSEQVIPAIVGNDIACSVLLTATDMLIDDVNDDWFKYALPSLRYVLRNFAYFGQEINPAAVVFDQDFYKNPPEMETILGQNILDYVYKVARNQFGTSGDGNHFVEWGTVDIQPEGKYFKKVAGKKYLALLSHFGSRAVGSTIASAYEGLALENVHMPKGQSAAPLSLKSADGRDYWRLMTWAGEFAEAGHRWLHTHLIDALAERVMLEMTRTAEIYSKHNFAWESDEGIIHRKGATPASLNQYGVIPATMGDNTQIVIGLGNRDSFNSASHGAGRTHSRGAALQAFKGNTHDIVERDYGIELIGGGADEDPRAYKQIKDVMKAQENCVRVIGEFSPKVVRMADPRF